MTQPSNQQWRVLSSLYPTYVTISRTIKFKRCIFSHFASKQCLFVNACWMRTCPQSGTNILGTPTISLGCLNVFRSNKPILLCFQNPIKIRGSMIEKSRITLASEYILGFKFTYKTVGRLLVQSLSRLEPSSGQHQ